MRIIIFLFLILGISSCGKKLRQQEEVKRHYVAGASVSGLRQVPRFADYNPYLWKRRKPWDYPIHGVDVSKYQNYINWRKVKQNNISFAYIKATEGGDFLDERFKMNWDGAERAGIKRGAYHFYYFCRSAAQQAAWFIRNVPKVKGALPPVLDIEWNHTSPTCKYRPEPYKIRREMRVFLARVERHYNIRPMIYTTVDFYHKNQLWKIKGYDFWLRSVAGHPSEIYPNSSWKFWQYTGSGIVPGISTRADINVFSGSKKDWLNWIK